MRALELGALFFVVLAGSAFADPPKDDLDPAYAADQAVLTTDSMQYEVDQFRQIGNLRSLEGTLQLRRQESEKLKTEFDRIEALYKAGNASKQAYDMAKMRYDDSLSMISVVEAQSHQARVRAELAKERLLEVGNPQVDRRRRIAELQLDVSGFEKDKLASDLASAGLQRDYLKTRMENGKVLLDKKVISPQEYENRRLAFQTADDQVHDITHQIEANEAIAVGLRKSLSRLQN